MKLLIAVLTAGALALPLAGLAQKKGNLSQEDQKRFAAMAQANMAEVAAGKVAQEKARSDDVKKFGQHMVEDHGKMLDEMKQMGEKKGARLPASPDKEQQAAMKKLEAMSGDNFDRAFMEQMVKDHQKALKLAQDTAKNAKDGELKQAAQKATPEIRKHLRMAQDLSKQAAAGGSKSGGKSK
jgi:putative membrane protein